MAGFEPHPELRPAVVTGASSGVGRATARALAMRGHPVVLGASQVSECEGVAAAIRADGGEAMAIHLDQADADSVTRFASTATQTLGAVEILVSVAPEPFVGRVLSADPDWFDEAVRANTGGIHRMVRALAPVMSERGRGDMVFVAAALAGWPAPAPTADPVLGWGLEEYVRSLQTELAGTGVRATMVRCGPLLAGGSGKRDAESSGPPPELRGPWGRVRHSDRAGAEGAGEAIAAVVSLPRGIHTAAVELQPEMDRSEPFRPGSGSDD
jgi:NAD(P)-dependent dehydrogenase (short-subunit alcohol dehydrogenase family)